MALNRDTVSDLPCLFVFQQKTVHSNLAPMGKTRIRVDTCCLLPMCLCVHVCICVYMCVPAYIYCICNAPKSMKLN